MLLSGFDGLPEEKPLNSFVQKAGLQLVASARLLGVDFGANRRRTLGVRKKRLEKFKWRAGTKLRRFKQGGSRAAHVFQTGAGPASSYGNACLGTSEGSLAASRCVTAFALGGNQTGSLDLRLMLADPALEVDPAFVLCNDPIVA